MTNNEKRFVKEIVELKTNVLKAQEYIHENYGIMSEYNEEDGTVKIWSENKDQTFELAVAKEYFNNTIDDDFVKVVF